MTVLRPGLAAFHRRTCPYCLRQMKVNPLSHGTKGARSPTRDHIIPRARGGRATLVCCNRCNADKGNRTPAEWQSALLDANDPRAITLGFWIKANPYFSEEYDAKFSPLRPSAGAPG